MSVSELDLTIARTPSEYLAWFNPVLEQVNNARDNREAALLHEDDYKFFYEELFPLRSLLILKQNEWAEATFQPIHGDQNHDVKVDGLTLEFLEITITNFDGDERFRMQEYIENGSVDALNAVQRDERNRPIAIRNEGEMRDHHELVDEELKKIQERILNKSAKPYPDHTGLVVYYDDYKCAPKASDCKHFEALIDELQPTWSQTFDAIFIVGAKGEHTFERTQR